MRTFEDWTGLQNTFSAILNRVIEKLSEAVNTGIVAAFIHLENI